MRYFKMNGCGNDFVVLDARAAGALQLSPEQARAIADRSAGAGCDQVIALERSIRGDVFMRIWNADGGEVSACGNAARCVAWVLLEEGAKGPVKIETRAGLLRAEAAPEGAVTVDMGSPLLKWEEVPVSRAMDTTALDLTIDAGLVVLKSPAACNMGNPHVTFFVTEVESLPIRLLGKRVQAETTLFPEGVNVGLAEVKAPDRLRLRVYERGAGLTKACGTGACAAVVNAHRLGLTGRAVAVEVDGGLLHIHWGDDDRVRMTGPVELERTGELPAP